MAPKKKSKGSTATERAVDVAMPMPIKERVARLESTMAEADLFDSAARMEEIRQRLDGAIQDIQSMCSNYIAEFDKRIASMAEQHNKYILGNIRLRSFVETSRILMEQEATKMKEMLSTVQVRNQNHQKYVEAAQGIIARDVRKAEQLVQRAAAQRALEERLQSVEEMSEDLAGRLQSLSTFPDHRSLVQEMKEELNNLSFAVSVHDSAIENLGEKMNLVKNPRPTMDDVVRLAQTAAEKRRHRSVSFDNGWRRPGRPHDSRRRVSSEDIVTTRTEFNTNVLRELRSRSRMDPSTQSRSSSTDSFGSVRTAP